jgi:hypothetical protein
LAQQRNESFPLSLRNFVVASPTDIPENVVVWQFGGKAGNVRSQNEYSTAELGNGYNMLCRTNNQYLTHQKTDVGINLGYTTNQNEHKIRFRLCDGQERDILTGERVALGIGGGDAFLRYAHRTVGINLEWAGDPVCEWLIFDATGEKGKPIPTGSWVAIINEKVEPAADFLVYLDRPGGEDNVAHVGWTTSPDWKGMLPDWLSTEKLWELAKRLILPEED